MTRFVYALIRHGSSLSMLEGARAASICARATHGRFDE